MNHWPESGWFRCIFKVIDNEIGLKKHLKLQSLQLPAITTQAKFI